MLFMVPDPRPSDPATPPVGAQGYIKAAAKNSARNKNPIIRFANMYPLMLLAHRDLLFRYPQ